MHLSFRDYPSPLSQSKNPRISLIATDLRGLRYVSAIFPYSIVVILEQMLEHVVDETSDDALHDSFNELSNTSFDALIKFLHRYHHLP